MKLKKEYLKQMREKERSRFIHPDGVAVFSFARQSSGDEVDSASIADQLAANRKNAEKLNLEIFWEDWDANVTGYSYPDTEHFRACYKLDLALQKYFSTHVATNNKAVFRDGLGFIFNKMHKRDILLLDTATRLVRATTIPTNESNVWNWLEMMEIRTFVNGLLYNPRDIGTKIISAVETQSKEEKAKNAIRGLQSAKDNGIMIGFHRLFGYDFSKTRGLQVLKPVKDEFEMVQNVFKSFLEGKGKNSICRELNSLKKYGSWTTNRLNQLLNNSKYAGMMLNSKNDLITCPAILESALSFEDWKKVQLIQLKYRPRKEKAAGRVYLLSGLVRCGYCGSIMKPQANRSGRADKYYICVKHASCTKQESYCRGSALIDTNEKQFGLENLMLYFGMLYFLRDTNSQEIMRLEKEKNELSAEYGKTQEVLRSMEETLKRNFMLFEILRTPLEKAAGRLKQIENDTKFKEMEILEIQRDDCLKRSRCATFTEWIHFPMLEKQKVMHKIFKQIFIYEDHYDVVLLNQKIFTIPKFLYGKRLFNLEVYNFEIAPDYSKLRITLKAPYVKANKSNCLYDGEQMSIIYLS